MENIDKVTAFIETILCYLIPFIMMVGIIVIILAFIIPAIKKHKKQIDNEEAKAIRKKWVQAGTSVFILISFVAFIFIQPEKIVEILGPSASSIVEMIFSGIAFIFGACVGLGLFYIMKKIWIELNEERKIKK